MSDFDVALSYRKGILGDEIGIIDDFIQLVSSPRLRLIIDEREKDSFYAGIEWFLPTAVVFFICKSYFDGFLNEMGKEHYQYIGRAMHAIDGGHGPPYNLGNEATGGTPVPPI